MTMVATTKNAVERRKNLRHGAGALALSTGLALVIGLAGCATKPGQKAAFIPSSQARHDPAARWRTPGPRHFIADISYLMINLHLTGVLEFYAWNDFRLIANENGALLFDARCNWAGVHTLRSNGRVPDSVITTLCQNLEWATRPPIVPVGEFVMKEGHLVATGSDGNDRPATYQLSPAGDPEVTRIELHHHDTLIIHYAADGTISLDRPGRFYSITMAFPQH
jgi:hypothetical protein